jgi:DHA3 family macrolide efflux protein-like MFS transporter
MFFAWFMNPIANGSMFAVLQAVVPAEMQGRVFTVLMSGSGAMVPLGLAIAGPLADRLGVQVWFVAAGVAMVMIGAGALFVPAVMRIEDKTTARTVVGDTGQIAGLGEPSTVPATAQ